MVTELLLNPLIHNNGVEVGQFVGAPTRLTGAHDRQSSVPPTLRYSNNNKFPSTSKSRVTTS